MGSADPRLNSFGKIDFCIQHQLCSYKIGNPAKNHVKPLPICIVVSILKFGLLTHASPVRGAIANLVWIAFYFCLHLGKYTGTTMDDQAFSLNDVTLFHGDHWLSLKSSADFEIKAATRVHYTFTKQKSMEEGTIIAHAWSEHPLCCPVLATIWQVMMHWEAF